MPMKVFVGLSGGVDSAVSAALLKEGGYDVTGVFIRIYRPEFIECTWKEDRLEAMRVCAFLSLPFREIDLSDIYKKDVVDSMIDDYRRGITPNPDVLCNKSIKFGAFLDWAIENGAEKIATGHYARVDKDGGRYKLLRGIDAAKDQSYFLYRLQQKELARLLFPVGDMLKSDVRSKAAALRLPNAKKHDSQGLCFIGDVSIGDFLKRFIDVKSGPVVDQEGRAIGEHEGAALLTLGQRHGFSVPSIHTPHYVTKIDAIKNTVTVSPERGEAASTKISLRDFSWASSEGEHENTISIQTRYREIPIDATFSFENDVPVVTFKKPHIAPPGQSLVMYRGNECIGGGVIEKSL
jgi:tRNA-specific 2-thiouridylase